MSNVPKWMGVTTLVWNFEANVNDSGAHKIARESVQDLILKHLPPEVRNQLKITTRANRVSKKQPKKSRVSGILKTSDVIPLLVPHDVKLPKGQEIVEFEGLEGQKYRVNVQSLRYDCFIKSYSCMACGLEGTRFYLERDRGSAENTAHLNLYGVEDGMEVLMTKDHIMPSVHGGKDHGDNLQTYCTICNRLKGSDLIGNEKVAELRQIHNEFKGKDSTLLVEALAKVKMGCAAQKNYGKSLLSKDSKAISKQKSLHTHLTVNRDLLITPPKNPKDDLPVAWPLSQTKPATRMKGYVLPNGTRLAVHRAKQSAIVCYIPEGTEIMTYHFNAPPTTDSVPPNTQVVIYSKFLSTDDELREQQCQTQTSPNLSNDTEAAERQ